MQHHHSRQHKMFILLIAVVVLLASGWGWREWSHAAQRQALLKSQTLNLSDIKLKDLTYEGKPVGKVGIYYDGQTAGTRNFVTGVVHLRPGMEPHPIHKHTEEEILIVTRGKGEIHCAGTTTKVAAGAIMYTGPNGPHGIRNTGKDDLTFYFVKWIGVPPRKN